MARLWVNEFEENGHIEPEVYGHFAEHLGACVYGGLYVGENSEIPNVNGMRSDVVKVLKHIKIPVLRWPGGCFADEYHWMDGIGPKEKRRKMINTNWGNVTESNAFGTHEYMELCRQLGCKTYINGNLGSGTVQEMSNWVEYMTCDGDTQMTRLRRENGRDEPWHVDYFGIGNESWGGGGNMRPEAYADEYRRYQTFVKDFGKKKMKRVACGANNDDYAWTRKTMEIVGEHSLLPGNPCLADGLSFHYYTMPYGWEHLAHATEFTEQEWYLTLRKALEMDALLSQHGAIMKQNDPLCEMAMIVDEWGTWFAAEDGTNPVFLYQQNTMRDALVAGITLNIFNKHCNRVKMANLAQIANVLQAVVLTREDKMILTPTYYVFDLFKYHQNATLLHSFLETEMIAADGSYQIPNLQESVSKDEAGVITVTLVNLSITQECPLTICFYEKQVNKTVATVITGRMNQHNTFEMPTSVIPSELACEKKGKKVSVILPPVSVTLIRIE